MKVIVSGSSGLVGSAVVAALREKEHEVTRLRRSGSRASDEGPSISWDPAASMIDADGLSGAEGYQTSGVFAGVD